MVESNSTIWRVCQIFLEREKSWLVVKEEHIGEAVKLFSGSKIIISTKEIRHLKRAIGKGAFIESFVEKKVLK